MIANNIDPPWALASSTNIRSRFPGQAPPLVSSSARWGESPFPVAGAFDDDLVAGVGQAVQGAVVEDGVVEEAEPFIHCSVAGDDKAGSPVAVED